MEKGNPNAMIGASGGIKKIGNYNVIGDLGQGFFSEVYRVKNARGEEFALKKIRRYQSVYAKSSDKETTDVLFLSRVNHKFILKFIERFRDTETDCWCIVTEICKEDLRKPIHRMIETNQVFTERTILDWFGMIAAALDHLHDKKILHRDLKPENVLISHDDILKLCDFGLAKLFEVDATQFSRCGTEVYMAPEVKNNTPYDMKCDVWSLGVILFELCNLHNAFDRNNKEIPSRYSKALQDTVKQMLEENPSERPNIKTVCHICDLHKNMRSSAAKEEHESNSAAKLSSQERHISSHEESGLSGAQSNSNQASSSSHNEKVKAKQRLLRDDKIPIKETEIRVTDIVSSINSGSLYVFFLENVHGYKWDETKKTFTHLFTCTPTGEKICSLVLAPQNTTSGTDQLYISVGSGKKTKKKVYRLGGSDMGKKVFLADTHHIPNECGWWMLGSEPREQILLVQPWKAPVLHILVKEQRHATVDLAHTEVNSSRMIGKIELIGRILLLGSWDGSKMYMFDMVTTKDGACINSEIKWGPVRASEGRFATLCHPVTYDYQQQHKQLHVITAEYDDEKECTVFREHIVGLFGVRDVTSGSSNQFIASSQSIQLLRVRGKLLPHCVMHERTSCPVLVARNFLTGSLVAIELANLKTGSVGY